MSRKYYEVVLTDKRGGCNPDTLPVAGARTRADADATVKAICRQVSPPGPFTHAISVLRRVHK